MGPGNALQAKKDTFAWGPISIFTFPILTNPVNVLIARLERAWQPHSPPFRRSSFSFRPHYLSYTHQSILKSPLRCTILDSIPTPEYFPPESSVCPFSCRFLEQNPLPPICVRRCLCLCCFLTFLRPNARWHRRKKNLPRLPWEDVVC